MIRVILKRRWRDAASGAEGTNLETITFDQPLLERALERGGFGDHGYDLTDVIGAEIIPGGYASAMTGDVTPKDAPAPEDGEGVFSGTRLNVK